MARDPDSGDLGVAVQSKFFNVGALVPWARAGVGAVATQALVNTTYGPRALDLLAQGTEARGAVAWLTASDPGLEYRQLGIVDTHGRSATHTGSGASSGRQRWRERASQFSAIC